MLPDNLLLTPDSGDVFMDKVRDTARAVKESFTGTEAYSGLTPQELKELIQGVEIFPDKGIGWDEILKRVREMILPHVLKVSSPDYMAHLHSPPLLESVLSELILSAANQSMDSWDQAPVATEVELEVVKTLCDMYGYSPLSDGIFTSGGSQSNLMGITLARDWYCNTHLNHDVKKEGLPENYNKIRIYTSEISHFTVEKSAHLLGLGYKAVRKVKVTPDQKMDISHLKCLIEEDIQKGNLPMLVVATAGTTDYGSIDAIDEIHSITESHNMWIHCDAAYGSGLILSDRYSDRIQHISLCDSVTLDFHKMFLLPISCGAFLLKDGSQFKHLTLHADYLNREEDEEEGYTNLVGKSMQTTRRFDALKVWMCFQSLGKDLLGEVINTTVGNAGFFYNQVKESSDFEAVTVPEISSVVFRYTGKGREGESSDDTNKRVRRALIHDKGIVIGQTVFESDVYLKLTLLNPLVTEKNLLALMDTIRELAI